MPHALHFLVLALAGWVNRHQEDRIDYLREEATPRSGRLALIGAGPGGASRTFFDGVEPKLAPHARLHDPEDLACVHREVLHDVVDRAHPRHIDALNRDARFERGVVA